MKGTRLLIAGVVAILLLGVGAFSLLRRQGASASSPAQPSAAITGDAASLPGKLEAVEVVMVAVPYEGRIESFGASVGQDIAEGQLLAEIRSVDLESERNNAEAELTRITARVSSVESTLIGARLESSKAGESFASSRSQLEAAQRDLTRQQMLYSKGAASKLSLEKYQAAFDAVSATHERLAKVSEMTSGRVADLTRELATLEQSLAEKTKAFEDTIEQTAAGDLRSPVDGLVVARQGEVGDHVTADVEDLFRIAVNVAMLKVVVTPPPPILEKIRAGQPAMIQIAELADPVESKVSEVRDGQVLIEFTSPNPVIKPGMSVQVVIKLT